MAITILTTYEERCLNFKPFVSPVLLPVDCKCTESGTMRDFRFCFWCVNPPLHMRVEPTLIVNGPNNKKLKRTIGNPYKIVLRRKLFMQKWQISCRKRFLNHVKHIIFFKKMNHPWFFFFSSVLCKGTIRDFFFFFVLWSQVVSERNHL